MFTRSYCVYFLLAIVFFCSFSTQIAANDIEQPKINPTNRTIELHTLFAVNEREVGEVILKISPDDALSLDGEGTLSLLTGVLDDLLIEKLRAGVINDELTVESFASAGLELSFDSAEFFLQVAVPLDRQKTNSISVKVRENTRQYSQPEKISGYLNMRAGYNMQQRDAGNSTSSSSSQNHKFELSARYSNLVLESEARYKSTSSTDDAVFSRLGTRFIYDFPDQSSRLMLGDVFISGSRFQDSADVLGISYSKNFTQIPTQNAKVTAGQTFTLEQPSDIEVLVDGTVLTRLSLEQGSYDLRDIPLSAGYNDIELLITNGAGEQERIAFSVATDQQLLAKGFSEYNLGVGVSAKQGNKDVEYDQEDPIFSGRYALGLNESITLGVNAQLNEEVSQVGLDLLLANRYGLLDLSLSSSDSDRGKGYSGSVGYEVDFGDNELARRAIMRYERYSPDFVGVSYDANNALLTSLNPIKYFLSANYSQRVSDSIYLNTAARYTDYREPSNSVTALSLGLSGSFLSAGGWAARVSSIDDEIEGNDTQASLSFSWAFNKRHRIRVKGNTRDNTVYAEHTYDKAYGRTGAFNTKVGIEHNDIEDAIVDARLAFSANKFYTSFDHQTQISQYNGEDEQLNLTRLRVESAIAFAGNKFAIGRPISNNYAIVAKHKSLKTNRLSIDPSKDGDLVNSDSFGNLLIPALADYRAKDIRYDIEDLPAGYDLGDGGFSLYPRHGSGYLLNIGSDAVITVIGTLLDADTNESIGLISGKAKHLDDLNFKEIEFFSNRTGKFALSGIKPGQYELTLATSPSRTHTITIDEDADTLLRLGNIQVK